MPVGDQNHRGVPVTMAPELSGRGDQPVDLDRGQVLPAAALGIGLLGRRGHRPTDPKINPAVNGPDAGCSWSCRELGSENDLVAEGIEAADQTLGHAMLVLLVEMSGTEFTELRVTSKDVEHREQDLVSNGHRGAFGTQARLE